MKNSSISIESLSSYIKIFSFLNFVLFLLCPAFASSPNEMVRFFGTGVLYIASFVTIYAIFHSVTNISEKFQTKQKQADDLEYLVSQLIDMSDIKGFVRFTVQNHVKNSKSINFYPESFFRLVCDDTSAFRLFTEELKLAVLEQKEIFEKSDKTTSDINRYALILSSLNELLQKLKETRRHFFGTEVDHIPTVVSGTEPSGSVSFKGISN